MRATQHTKLALDRGCCCRRDLSRTRADWSHLRTTRTRVADLLPQEETRRVSSCTSFRRRGAIAAVTLTAMARRRLRTWLNWALRWSGVAFLIAVSLVYVATLLGVPTRVSLGPRAYLAVDSDHGPVSALVEAGPVSWRLPVFWPGVLLLAVSLFAWLSYARPRGTAGTCPSCRYDLSGLPPGSPCPECAAKPPSH